MSLKFLGASVSSFSCSIGWGGQPSSLNVRLAEDYADGDVFYAEVGKPAYFNTGSWTFNGIVQSYSANADTSVNPIYEVTLTDPRYFLDGTQIILRNYTEVSNYSPNVLNVFGYLNYVYGFGGTRVNEGGVPYRLVLEAISNLTDDDNDEGYGRSLQFNGHSYSVDLSNLPILPEYFRVGGGLTSMSIMEFIGEVCDAARHDYFFTLESSGNFKYIKLHTISRENNPQTGRIADFVSSVQGAKAKDIGYEYRNDTNNKFLIGGNVEAIHLVEQNEGSPNTIYDDIIMPFNGLDRQGNAVVGSGRPFHNEYNFTVDSSKINVVGIGEDYRMSVKEMRAALSSKDDWEFFMVTENSRVGSPHYGVADRINLNDGSSTNIYTLFKESGILDWDNFPVHKLYPTLSSHIEIIGRDPGSFHEENIGALYNFVLNHANQYFGRQYMIRIPFAESYRDEETGIVYTSREPAEGGYVNDESISEAINRGILPVEYYKLSLSDGRISCYCVYSNSDKYYYDKLRPDEDVVDRNRVYLKSEVLPEIVYLDRENLYSPRVVVSIPLIMQPRYDEALDRQLPGGSFSQENAKSSYGQTLGLMELNVRNHLTEIPELSEDSTEPEILQRIKQDLEKLISNNDSEEFLNGLAGNPPSPDLFAIPLKNNLLTYGPWYANGAYGKTDFEQDESLTPWNYGTYENMEQVAISKVSQSYSRQTFAEAGSVEVPGLPTVELGRALLSQGPYVTDITVSVSENEITTRYDMSTWTSRPGRVEKLLSDRMDRINKKNLQLQKDLQIARRQSKVANDRASAINVKSPSSVTVARKTT